MYAPQMGRFLQRDPVASMDIRAEGIHKNTLPIQPDTESRERSSHVKYITNLYGYVDDNPVKLVDPFGLEPWDKTGVFICGSGIHTYLDVDNVGYGFYAESHVSGNAGASDDLKAVLTKGVVVNTDHGLSKQCVEIEVDRCFCPANTFKAKIKEYADKEFQAYNKAGGNRRTYSFLGANCHTWVSEMVTKVLDADCERPRWWQNRVAARKVGSSGGWAISW